MSVITNKIKELKEAVKNLAPHATVRIEISNLPMGTFSVECPQDKMTTHSRKIGEFNHTVLQHQDEENNLLLESAPFNPVPVVVRKVKEGK